MIAGPVMPSDRLLRAISLRIGPLSNVVSETGDWASATYVGVRHRLWFDAPPGPATEAFLENLRDAELPMPGHFVADIDLIERYDRGESVRIGVAALTIQHN